MVDKKIVEYVANLARIDVTEEEKELLVPQLSKIFGYIDQLRTLVTDNVGPMRQPLEERALLRQDSSRVSDSRDAILVNAPSREGDYFKIPKVIE